MFHIGLFTTHLPYILILVFYAATFLLPDKSHEHECTSDLHNEDLSHFHIEKDANQRSAKANFGASYTQQNKTHRKHYFENKPTRHFSNKDSQPGICRDCSFYTGKSKAFAHDQNLFYQTGRTDHLTHQLFSLIPVNHIFKSIQNRPPPIC